MQPSDQDGRLYVLDGVNHRVVVYDAEGRVQFQFGNRGSELGQFAYPLGIATDPNGNCLRGGFREPPVPNRSRPWENRWRQFPCRPLASGLPPDPTDVAVDPARRRLYIADNDNHVIHVFDLAGRRFESIWGGPGQGQRQFRFPFLIDISTQGLPPRGRADQHPRPSAQSRRQIRRLSRRLGDQTRAALSPQGRGGPRDRTST